MASKLEKMKKQSKGNLSNRNMINNMDVVLKGTLPEDKDKIVRVELSKIQVNPNNDYRVQDTEEGIATLAADIENNGLLHNLVVSKRENGKYVIISGERRFRALNLLFEREVEKGGDVAKYRTVPCRVVEGLTERQEMIMLDAANLQARGGAGDEMQVRNAMVRYRDNSKAEYNLTDKEAKDLLVQITSFSRSSITSNMKIRDNLREELQNMLDKGEITKRAANSFVKLTQKLQKDISDSFISIKNTSAIGEEKQNLLFEQAMEAFVLASEMPTDAKIQQEVALACTQVSQSLEKYLSEVAAQAGKKADAPEMNKQEKQDAQRDLYLKKCKQIKKGLTDLSKKKTISRIKEFDATADEENRRVLTQIEEIIRMAQALKHQLDGTENG